MNCRLSVLVVALALLVGSPLGGQIHRVSDSVRASDLARVADHHPMLMVPMRDGVRLATEVYVPKDGAGSRFRSSSGALPTTSVQWLDPIRTGRMLG